MNEHHLSEELRRSLVPAPRSCRREAGSLSVGQGLCLEEGGEWLAVAERTLRRAMGGGCPLKRHVCKMSSEGYALEITGDGIVVECQDLAGWRWGLCTLRQLLELCGETLPCLRLEDRPAFAVRGVMLDVTRGRVWTMEHLRQTIRQLSSWKYNLLQLYFETSYASPGNEVIWGDSSPITPSELSELDAYARDFGLELCVCQNCFGHLTRWLIEPRFRPLAEIQPGMTFTSWGSPSGVPQSLNPLLPESLAFARSLLESFFPYYRSSYINLGCDETLDLGCGCCREAAEAQGVENLFGDFVTKLCQVAEASGKRPMIWADFPLSHPTLLRRMPKHLLYLLWDYQLDSPFASWCRLAKESGHDFWVCPGTCSWSAFFGDSIRRHANMRKAAREGLAGGASGYLLTDWGDGGHRQCWGPSLMALAEGGCLAWCGDVELEVEAVGREAFGNPSVGRWYEEAGTLFQFLKGQKLPTLYADMHTAWHSLPQEGAGAQAQVYAACEERIRRWMREIPSDASEQLQAEMRLACGFALVAARRAVLRRQGRLVELKALAVEMPPLMDEFQRLWLLRSRSGGLSAAMEQWRMVEDELKRVY